MNAYDPQARQARSRPAAVSPVDTLLGVVEEGDESAPVALPIEDLSAALAADRAVDTSEEAPGRPDGEVRPFEAPPVEMTDEYADRLHRLGVLATVAAILFLLVALRKRRRTR